MYISLVPSSRHDVVKSDKSYFRIWPYTAVKSGISYERAIQEHILLRAPYNNKYLIFSYHSPFSTRENAKKYVGDVYINNIGHFCKYFLSGYPGNGQCICIMIIKNNDYKITQIHTQFNYIMIRFILYIMNHIYLYIFIFIYIIAVIILFSKQEGALLSTFSVRPSHFGFFKERR